MRTAAVVDIDAPPAAVWQVVTDIQNAATTIQAIDKVEILALPHGGLVGLKWRETRTMLGKTATETMWITAAVPTSHYETRAESHGAVYTTRVVLEEQPPGTRLRMEFEARPVTLGARLVWGLLGFAFKGATRKALHKDLVDIKAKVESA